MAENLIHRSPNTRRTVGILALVVGVVCWGFTPVILRRLTGFLDAWTTNGIRYPITAVLYWPLLFLAFRSGRLTLSLLRRCIIPAVCALGGQVFWALSFYEMQATEVGFLVRLSMLWAIFGSMLLFRDERRLLTRPGFYVGVFLIGGGFLAMSLFGAENAAEPAASLPILQTGNYQLGICYVLFCGAFFGLYMVAVRRCIPDVDPLLSFPIVANFVSVGTVAGMFLKGEPSLLLQQSAYSWTLLLCSSLLGLAVGHLVMFVAVQRLGAAITSSCQTLMPFVTAAVASVFLNEALDGRQWVAGSVMVAGVIMLLSLRHEISEKPNAD